ncbi:MAG: hypothetical protein AAF725_23210, partial [Acidobacteriota bacterium]
MRRLPLAFILPTLGLILLSSYPWIEGSSTLYYRDFLSSHLPLKAAQAQLMSDGHWLPLLDPYRSGGMPMLGNPNALPLYPTTLLFAVASPVWALNAHIWLHWLLAPFAFAWLGRAWGLSPRAAWAGAAIYATSGYFLSLFNLYNLVAGAALAPAFVAACIEGARGAPRRWPAAGALWALLLLSGDPMTAALAAALGLSAAALHAGGGERRRRTAALGALALGAGTVLAAPQWVEMLRILPDSFRGHWRYEVRAALAQSFDPRSVVDWILPFFTGRLDYSFWGQGFFGGNPPLLPSLYPGTLAAILALMAGRPRRGSALLLWSWGFMTIGFFVATGYHNPLMWHLIELPGASALRYPIKVWLLVALTGSLLAARGFERALESEGRRLARWLGGIAALYGALWLALLRLPEPFANLLRSLEPQRLQGAFFDAERLRWTTVCFFVLLTALGLWGAALLLRRRPGLAAPLLVGLHALSQIFLLAPLVDSDESAPYSKPPELLAHLPADSRIAHGFSGALFGPLSSRYAEKLPDSRFFWLTRETF